MRFWSREIMGWFLVALGILGFFFTYEFLMSHMVVEAGTMTVVSVFLFRGGIHLLKVATAAQICLALPAEQTEPPALRISRSTPSRPASRSLPSRR